MFQRISCASNEDIVTIKEKLLNRANLYTDKIEPEMKNIKQLIEMKNGAYREQLRDFSITDDLLDRFKGLHNALIDIENNNPLNYYVERIEQKENFSVDRNWCTFADRYTTFDNTYRSKTYMGPGNVDVYLNGVMLDRTSYSIFDSCNVILNDLNVAGGSDEFDLNDPDTHRLIKFYINQYDPNTNKA